MVSGSASGRQCAFRLSNRPRHSWSVASLHPSHHRPKLTPKLCRVGLKEGRAPESGKLALPHVFLHIRRRHGQDRAGDYFHFASSFSTCRRHRQGPVSASTSCLPSVLEGDMNQAHVKGCSKQATMQRKQRSSKKTPGLHVSAHSCNPANHPRSRTNVNVCPLWTLHPSSEACARAQAPVSARGSRSRPLRITMRCVESKMGSRNLMGLLADCCQVCHRSSGVPKTVVCAGAGLRTAPSAVGPTCGTCLIIRGTACWRAG